MYRHWQNEVSSIAEYAANNEPVSPEATPYMVGGFPVVKELYEFMQALQAKNGSLRFGVNRNLSNTWAFYSGDMSLRYPLFLQLLVYRAGDVYAMGRIGYHNPNLEGRHNNTDDSAYTVYSRDIENTKYRTHNAAYRTRASKRMNAAVTLALKHLKTCTPVEIANESKLDYSLKATSRNREVSSKLQDVKYELSRNSSSLASMVLDELLAAKNKGYSFDSPKVKEYIEKYEAAYTEYEADGNRKVSSYNVRLYEKAGVAMADVMLFSDVADGSLPTNLQTIPVADMPEDIAGKLAVLDMLSKDDYVEGVGVNVGKGVYWVDRDVV
jgi:hypothetical protein